MELIQNYDVVRTTSPSRYGSCFPQVAQYDVVEDSRREKLAGDAMKSKDVGAWIVLESPSCLELQTLRVSHNGDGLVRIRSHNGLSCSRFSRARAGSDDNVLGPR